MKKISSGGILTNRTNSERNFSEFSSPLPSSRTAASKHKNNNINRLINKSNKYLEQTKKFFHEYVQRSPKANFPSVNTECEDLPPSTATTTATVTSVPTTTGFSHAEPTQLTERNVTTMNHFFSPRSSRSPGKANLSKSVKGINFAMDFSQKNIGKFPSKLKLNAESLVILDLSSNKLRNMPEPVFDCRSLKIFKIDNNLIKFIDERLFLLPLELFSISNNFIEKIPNNIVNWRENKIKSLNLSHNQIIDLPDDLMELGETLNYLHINNNPFVSIPISFKKLVNLHELSFDWLKYIYDFCNEEALVKLPELKGVLRKIKEICEKYENLGKDCVRFLDLIESLSGSTHKFDLKRLDNKGRTLLHEAALQEDIGVVRTIISVEPSLMNSLDEDGHTPLSLAIKEEKYFAAKILMFNGTNLNIGGGPLGCCLHLGVLKLQFYLVQDLLKHKADINQQDAEGNSPLHYLVDSFSLK